jgi:protease-4
VLGKVVTAGTFEKLGMNIESIARGRFADIHSPTRPYDAAERAKVEEMMQATYDQFVEKAAQGRKTTPERIDAVAQGRVWTGAQGKEVGLVDELGGLARAIAMAKQRARIPADSEVELVIYPPRRTFYDLFRAPLIAASPATAAALLIGEAQDWPIGKARGWPFGSTRSLHDVRAIAALSAPLRLFRRGEPLALMPNVFLR